MARSPDFRAGGRASARAVGTFDRATTIPPQVVSRAKAALIVAVNPSTVMALAETGWVSTISRLLDGCDGVIRTRELLRAGLTVREIAAAVHRGDILRARQGCFVRPDTPVDLERAVRVGGVLTSFSALASYGVAVPEGSALHVHVPLNAARLRQPQDRRVRLDRSDDGCTIHHHHLTESSGRTWVSLVDALLQASHHGEPWDVIAAIDSARHRGLLDVIDVERLRNALSDERKWFVDESTDLVGEYIESVARIKLLVAGVRAAVQVNVLDERWIDLVVGDRLAIECDGKGKYERGATVDSDRRRDAFLEGVGYHMIRLSYAMIIYDWDATLATILALVERGDHLDRASR